MIYQNVELHNVAEAHGTPSAAGLRLQRVPERVRRYVNPLAQDRYLQPENVEIRFKARGPCRVTLSSAGRSRVTVFHGLFDSRRRYSLGVEPETIEVAMPDMLRQLKAHDRKSMVFSPDLHRLILGGPQRDPVYIHAVEGDGVSPPETTDAPALRYLAYGTSITQGLDAEGPHLSYAAQTARNLGADLINLGVDGSAHCEPQLAEYIAARTDWHVATLELSVNMQKFSVQEFYDRVSYMVNTIASADVTRPVVCITLLPYYRDLGIEVATVQIPTPRQYRQALQRAVDHCPYPNVHLLHGPDLLVDVADLAADLIHPSDFGMTAIAWKLASSLKFYLSSTEKAGQFDPLTRCNDGH